MKTFILLFLLALNSYASLDDVKALFMETFDSGYESGKCGLNIMGLIRAADQKGIDLSQVKLVQITNEGFSVFGMVNVEMAREGGRLNPARTQRLPGETNWYHHVILEVENYIFDFDFTNGPVVLTKQQYFDAMFFSEVKGKDNHYVGRENKMKDYKVSVTDAREVLIARQERRNPQETKLKLLDYLGD
jgi:hypothetical protein